MFLYIDSETLKPIFMLDQMLLIGDIGTLHKNFGIAGVYFAVLYGWRGSPYISEADESKRAKTVLSAIKNKNWYTTKGELFTYKELIESPFSPEDPLIQNAINAINYLAPCPLFDERDKYAEWLEREQSDFDSEEDPAIRKKIIDNVKELRRSIEAVNVAIESKMKQTKQASLNDFIQMLSFQNKK